MPELVPLTADLWAYGVLAIALLAASYTDVRTGKIPNWITLPCVAAGLVGHTVVGLAGGEGLSGLRLAGGGLAIGFIPLYLAWRAGGIGGGDAKMMAAVGALTGWRFTLAAMFYGFAVAAVMALFVMVTRRILWRTLGRIWRFLYLAMLRAKPVDPATPDSPKIPFGLALCIGSALQLTDTLLGGPVTSRLWS